ncbi:MAG: hypothetical protein PVI57_02545 [Gemmatimonadota bacterium]|jgi:folate-binding protein YgfZ
MTDGGGGYRAALEGVAVLDRSARGRLRVGGRAPVQMLGGILTSSMPGPETPVEPGVRTGRAFYSALLTPKGRMVSDLRVFRVDEAAGDDPPAGAGASPGTITRGPAVAPGRGGGSEELLLDVPRGGVDGTLAHFRRFLPPRFATVEDVSDEAGMVTVLGPEAAARLSLHGLGLRVDPEVLEALEEGEYRAVETGGGTFLRVVATADVAAPAFDVLADRATADGIRRALLEAGTEELSGQVWEALRVEAGRPAWGVDMDEETIPVEAGIGERAIDHGKGCYTGQEVIVRIRDRGHVNRSLRGLRLPPGPLPSPGTVLHAPDVRGERAAGAITSAVDSPRMGPVALAYVRREVTPPGPVRLGSSDGPEATVVDLDGGRWGPEGTAG